MVDALTRLHAALVPGGVLVDTQPVSLRLPVALDGEPVEGGANEKYFGQWQDLKRDLRMRAYLDLVSLRYERRVRRYGYSLLSPS